MLYNNSVKLYHKGDDRVDTNRVVIEIGSRILKIRTTESAQKMQQLAEDVSARMAAIQEAFPSISEYEAAMFAMLNMAEEIEALKCKYDELESRIHELREVPIPTPAMPKKRPLTKKSAAKEPEPVPVE